MRNKLGHFRFSARGLQVLLSLLAFCTIVQVPQAHAERLKDLTSMQGVRDNPLIGYGLMVGLDGTGDQTMQTPFTTQSLTTMLAQLGVTMPSGISMQLKNVAAVIVTATLPAFARPGQNIDVTVSSMGNAKSLRGGTLMMTPLKGADGQVYAIAQGNMVLGGAGASANGSKVQVNQLSTGRIPSGALIERGIDTPVGDDGGFLLELHRPDFSTAQRVVEAINGLVGDGTAAAQDARVIRIKAPDTVPERIALLARLDNVEVAPSRASARVVVNARTGSVVMNQAVNVLDCAVAHGNLTVVINTQPAVSQPNPLSGGATVANQTSQISVSQAGSALQMVRGGASLADVVKALNSLGANPQDLVSILQAMKSVGALRAELEII